MREQALLGGGQLHVGAVVALGLDVLAEAEEQQHGPGRPGEGDGLLAEGRVVLASGGETAREGHLAGGRADGVEGGADLGGVDVGGAGALVARGGREVADHGEVAGVRREGQQGVLVAQQHDRAAGRLEGDLVVGGGVDLRPVAGGGGAAGGLDDLGGGAVQGGVVDLPGLERGGERLLGGGIGGHLQVQTGLDGGRTVHDGAPVGDDEALEAPLLAQHLGEQVAVAGHGGAEHGVVGAHDGPRLGAGDDGAEGAQVDLVEGALVHGDVHAHAVGLLVVQGEVLHGGAHALVLHGAHVGDGELAGEVRVLGEVLEVAAAQRGALDVHAGAEHDGDALGAGLLGDGGGDGGGGLAAPGGGEAHGGREAGGGQRVVQAQVVALGGLGAQPVGAVADHDRGEVELGDGLGAPEVLAAGERDLALAGQGRDLLAAEGEGVGALRGARRCVPAVCGVGVLGHAVLLERAADRDLRRLLGLSACARCGPDSSLAARPAGR